MNLRMSSWASCLAAATVVLSAACTSNNGAPTTTAGASGGQTQGGAGGKDGQGGQTTGSGGARGGTGGDSGQGGRTTSAGGSTGDTGGNSGQGGRTTATGGNLGGTGGTSSQGGQSTEPPTDAAAGAGGRGGQGGSTSRPPGDASDTAVGGAGGGLGTDGGGGSAREVAGADAVTVGNPRRVLLCDEGNRRVLLVDLQNPGSAVWSTPLDDATKYGDGLRDIQLVGGDRVAASVAKGYVELDINTGAIRKEVTKFSGVESLRRLPSGNTVLGGNSDGGVTLQELDSQDAAVTGHKVTFTNYSQFRILRRTPQDTFLIGVANTLAEVNWNKQTVWQMDFPAAPGHDPDYIYQGLRLPDNTIAVTTGYAVSLSIVDPAAKKVLTTIGGQGQPNATTIAPYFYAGFQVLPNGHFVVTNWEGHGGGNGGKGLQLLEYDPTGLLVWSWKQDAKLVSSLHHVIVLDGLDTSKLHDDVNGVLAPVTQ
jgi:hypothetical protein